MGCDLLFVIGIAVGFIAGAVGFISGLLFMAWAVVV